MLLGRNYQLQLLEPFRLGETIVVVRTAGTPYLPSNPERASRYGIIPFHREFWALRNNTPYSLKATRDIELVVQRRPA